MIWRPWVVLGMLFVAVLANAFLIYKEELPHPTRGPQAIQAINPLRKIQYIPASRRVNFETMGLDRELAQTTSAAAGNYNQKALQKLITDDPSTAGDALCGGGAGLAPPYAALELLVTEENGIRRVVPARELIGLQKQPWYATAPVEGVFHAMEPGTNRPADATLMGVSALLLGLESDAISGNAPFGGAVLFTSRFGALMRDSKTEKIRDMAVKYFSLMHFLAELANDDNTGICAE